MAQTARRDYYEVLGVPRDADDRTVREAFRTLALRYHPDRSKEPDAEERFKEIAEAYAVLSDPRKRVEYDARGFTAVAGVSPEDLWSGIDLGDLLADLGLSGVKEDFGAGLSTGDLFERTFGTRGRPERGPVPGADIETTLTIPLERVLHGGSEPVTIRHPSRCENCRGSGAEPGTTPRTCPACHGAGQQVAARHQRGITVQQISACPACGGSGTVIDERCPQCGGLGEVERRDVVTVRIPPGIEEGVTLRVPGYGAPSPQPGGPAGDAQVSVRTAADARFIRRGANLWRHEEVSVTEAVLGTSRTVPTLDGDARLTVPPGTQPGTILRITGKGLPRWVGTGRGDLRVSVTVHVPDHLDEPERHLYEQLRQAESAGR